MALFSHDDYERSRPGWAGPSGRGLLGRFMQRADAGRDCQAGKRLGHESLRELFSQVAVPVAGR